MRHIFSILLLPVFFLTLSQSYAQISNIKAMEGTWTGQWDNTTYESNGNVNLVMTVDEVNNTAHGEWNVGGNILAIPRDPFTSDIILTPDGFVVDFNSPIWGDISGTGFHTGAFTGVATDCPDVNVQAISSTGTFNTETISSTFSMTYYGEAVNGTFNVTKQNPIDTPTNLNGIEISSVNLTWDDNSDNEDGWKLDRKTGLG
ncbi:hypothetical protein ACFLR4_04345, partial [Bacteroidota bacterium]